MSSTLHATVTAEGDQALLDAYRASLNDALADESGVAMKELHTPGRLDYRLTVRGGLPFPALVAASADVPELVLRVEWQDAEQGRSGAATLEAGALKEQASSEIAPDGGARRGVEVRADADGTLVLAVACRRMRRTTGSATRSPPREHAFFRVRPGPMLEATDGVELEWAERWRIASDGAALYAELDPREPLDDALAAELRQGRRRASPRNGCGSWPTIRSKRRWSARASPPTAIPVRDANLRSQKLRGTMRREGDAFTFSSLDEAGREVAALVTRHWLQSERH